MRGRMRYRPRAMPKEPEDKVAARKEVARRLRREAYLAAKERRAKDPKFLAMKEAAREQRRAAYQRAKDARKSAAAKQKQRVEVERAETRAKTDEELMKLVRKGAKSNHGTN